MGSDDINSPTVSGHSASINQATTKLRMRLSPLELKSDAAA